MAIWHQQIRTNKSRFGHHRALSRHADFSCKLWITLRALKEKNKRWQWPGGKVQVSYNKDPVVRAVDTIPPRAFIPECSGDKHCLQSLAGKILTTLTKEGENEGQRETQSTGNSKQTHRHELDRRGEDNVRRSSRSKIWDTHTRSYKFRVGDWKRHHVSDEAQC